MMHPWFTDAKLGIFMHWGIYAVKGVVPSWPIHNQEMSPADYMEQARSFTTSRWNPDAWAKLFKAAGAGYAVLTSKHHDGVALWDTALSDLSIPKITPARRDLIGPYCDAMRREGLKAGLYFSHNDWSHPDHATILPRTIKHGDPNNLNPFAYPQNGKEDPVRWQQFIRYHRGQIKELCDRYSPDILWFDGDFERDVDQFDMQGLRKSLDQWAPQCVLCRLKGGFDDYDTPEQGLPIVPPSRPWEFNMTCNDSWGYDPRDKNYKTSSMILRYFCDVLGMGGNMLLDVGPMEDGTIPQEQVDILETMGAWIGKHKEAIYGGRAGLPAEHFYGPSTLSADGRTLYLFLYSTPTSSIALKGFLSPVDKVSVLENGTSVSYRQLGGASWLDVPGVYWLDVPKAAVNPEITVLKVELKEPLRIYRGSGGIIEKN